MSPLRLDTQLAQAGTKGLTLTTQDVTPPIHLSTTFERAGDLSYPGGYVYSRHANPTRDLLESTLAGLDGGEVCVAFASGMAAVNAVVQAFPGTFLLLPDDAYHGLRTLVTTVFHGWGVRHMTLDYTNLEAVERALKVAMQDTGTSRILLWMETPSNPLLKVSDMEAVVCMAKNKCVAKPVLTLVDATWSTPFLVRPLELGVDMVLHSVTKYIGGHSDLLGGAVILKERLKTFPDGETVELAQPLRAVQQAAGAVLSPFDSWLVLRGVRSLGARMRLHCANAYAVARALERHAQIDKVWYPGLESHPGHEVAKRMMGGKGYGGMLSIQVKGGRDAAVRFVGAVKVFRRATSLGGTESLLEHRRSVEGPLSTTPEDLVRISVGLEDVQDLIDDLLQALDSMIES